MTRRRYTILLYPDREQGGYWVRVPDLKGCYSQGDTLEEAIRNAREAIEGHLLTLAELGEPIPEEPEQPQAIIVDVGDAAA